MKKRYLTLTAAVCLGIAVVIYNTVFVSSLTLVNGADFDLVEVEVFNPRTRSANFIVWEGKLASNSTKKLRLPSGGSDENLVIRAAWKDNEVFSHQTYPAMGAGVFRFEILADGQVVENVKSKLFR